MYSRMAQRKLPGRRRIRQHRRRGKPDHPQSRGRQTSGLIPAHLLYRPVVSMESVHESWSTGVKIRDVWPLVRGDQFRCVSEPSGRCTGACEDPGWPLVSDRVQIIVLAFGERSRNRLGGHPAAGGVPRLDAQRVDGSPDLVDVGWRIHLYWRQRSGRSRPREILGQTAGTHAEQQRERELNGHVR